MKRAFYLSAFAALLLANVAGWSPCCCLFNAAPADTASECARCVSHATPEHAALVNSADACCHCQTLTTASSGNATKLTSPVVTLAAMPVQPSREIPRAAFAVALPPDDTQRIFTRPIFLLYATLLI